MKIKITAILTTGLMLAASAAMPLGQAAGAQGVEALPEWVPSDYASAVEFQNNYGATHIQDGLICVVHDSGNPQMSPHFEVNGVYAEQADCLVSLEDYAAYPEADDSPYIMVSLFRPEEEMTISYKSDREQTDYTFTTQDGDEIIETDIYGWLPDCAEEYGDYLNAHHQVSVKDNCVLICTSYSSGTAFRWNVSENGGEYFELAEIVNCSTKTVEPMDGGTVENIYVYKALKDGYSKIQYNYGTKSQVESSAIADCVVLNDAQEVLLSSQMKVTLVDSATGEVIPINEDAIPSISTDASYETPNGTVYSGPIMRIESDPCVLDMGADLFNADSFSFELNGNGLPKNYKLRKNASRQVWDNGTVSPEDSIIVTKYDNGAADVVFKLDYVPSGDANGDGVFSIADAVMLNKWLLGRPDAAIGDWEELDLCRDNKLNVFDFIAMKQRLVEIYERGYIEPDVKAMYPQEMIVVKDSIKMYQGPSLVYPEVAEIPGARIQELGYMKGNNDWVFVEFDGTRGWVSIRDEDGNYNVSWLAVADKPVIYLYPEEETDVHVELDLTEAELATTYPRYNGGWDVVASPDGTLLNKADGTHHKYLFWDAKNVRTRFDFSKGFCVAGADTEAFLKEKLTYMGLTEEEMNEFIVYWLPRMEHNPYNLISFQGKAYTDTAKLNITPAPDSLLRIFMTYVPLEEEVQIAPQQLETFERKGFTVVEWGGSQQG